MPAPATTMSMPPKRSTPWATAASTSESSVTSAAIDVALASPRRCTISLSGSASRSTSTTFAPRATSCAAVAAPTPRAPPVITATLPCKLPTLQRYTPRTLVGCSSRSRRVVSPRGHRTRARRDPLWRYELRRAAVCGVPRASCAGGRPRRPRGPLARAPERAAALARCTSRRVAAALGRYERAQLCRGARAQDARARNDGRPLPPLRDAGARGVRERRHALRRPHRRGAVHARGDRPLRRRRRGERCADRAWLRL